jgi:hypothetical protein
MINLMTPKMHAHNKYENLHVKYGAARCVDKYENLSPVPIKPRLSAVMESAVGSTGAVPESCVPPCAECPWAS